MNGKNDPHYPYLYETHCHTAWCSACAHSTPQEMAAAYYNAGYAGMMITDHFLRGNTAVPRSLPWEEKMTRYGEAWLAARDWAKDKDFDVLFGIEHAYGDGKEVLTYGISPEFLIAHPDIHRLPLSEYAALVHEEGGFLSMAHPYRDRPYINMAVGPQPEYLDAVEAFNFYNYPDENAQAVELARRTGLPCTSGGDEHICTGEAIGHTGVAFPQRVRTGQEFAAALRSRDYKIMYEGRLVPCTFA